MRLLSNSSVDCEAVRRALREGRLDIPEAHLAHCETCRALVEASRRFDARIAAGAQPVAVPETLLERIRQTLSEPASVAEAAAAAGTPTPSVTPPLARGAHGIRQAARFGRTGKIALAGGLGACVLTLLLALALAPTPGRLPEVAGQLLLSNTAVPMDASSARGLSGKLPAGWFGDSRLRPTGLGQLPLSKGAPGSVVELEWVVRPLSPTMPLRLVVIGERQLQKVPVARSLAEATIIYAPQGAWISWREGKRVFILASPRGPATLEAVQRYFAQSRPLS